MSPTLKWTKISASADPEHGTPCARSSHGVSLLRAGTRAIIYGGEHVARTPLDDAQATWALDMKNGVSDAASMQWRLIQATPPPQRLGHAQAVHKDSFVYIFGGRAGITMKEKAMNDLWKLDCSGAAGTETWTQVVPSKPEDAPEARSFHKMICVEDSLYVFGGCSANHGRVADLHRYDIPTNTWHALGASKHLRGRGGPNLLTFDSSNFVGVVAGFCGEETNDGHRFDRNGGVWEEDNLNTKLHDMRPRSVCISAAFPSVGVAVIFGGEVDPSAKGHEGAGGFENDVVLLDEKTGQYIKSASSDEDAAAWPECRGWSDGDCIDAGGGSLLIFGGLAGDDANPKRLDDLWRLHIVSA